MTPGVRSGALCTVWVVWTAVVVTHYFTVPADRFHVFEGPVGFPEFWREATMRGVLAIAAAAAITLAAWTVGQRLSQWFVNSLFTESLEALVFQLAIGFASLSYALFALACVGLYRRPVVGGIVILLAVCGCVSAPRVLKLAVRSFACASARRRGTRPLRRRCGRLRIDRGPRARNRIRRAVAPPVHAGAMAGRRQADRPR